MIRDLLGADLRSLAALRVGISLILILDLIQRISDIAAHLTDDGALPRSLAIETASSRWLVSLHFASGAWQVQFCLIVFAGVFAVLLLIGFKTRFATFASWILLVSLIHRNPYVAQGGDMLLRLLLFWAMFLPWGARFSVDSAWSHESHPPAHNRTFSAATLAYSAQIAVMYWFSVLAKTGTEWWSEGSAVYYALNIDYLTTPIGQLLSGLPLNITRLATWSVLGFEAMGPLLLFSPWGHERVRTVAAFSFMAMHGLFLLTMFIGIFPLVGIVSMLFFLPAWFWDRFLPRLTRPAESLKIDHPAGCIACSKMTRLLKVFLLIPSSQIPDASYDRTDSLSPHRWFVVDQFGRQSSGYDALLVVARSSPCLRPVLPLLRRACVRRAVERVRRTEEHSLFAQWLFAGPHDLKTAPFKLCRPTAALIIFLTIYVVTWNLANLPHAPITLSERARVLGNLLGLYQSWELFAPFPAKDDGWYVIPATLKNGKRIDLLRNGTEIDWQKPKHIALTIKNNRWRKFFESLRRRDFLGESYAAYLCRQWNRHHPHDDAIVTLEIIYLLEWTDLKTRHVEPRPMRISKHQCIA